MDLVDAHRRGGVVGLLTLGDPGGVVPLVVGLGDLGGRRRRHLGGLGHRVGLVAAGAVLGEHGELVGRAGGHAGDEQLPHARGTQGAHRVLVGVPAVEVADDGHRAGVRGPHGEGGAHDVAQGRVVAAHVGAQHLPEPLVAALADQVDVQLTEGGQEVVRVGHDHRLAARPGDLEAVVQRAARVEADGPDVVADGDHLDAVAVVEQLDLLGTDLAGAHHGAVLRLVPAVEVVRRPVTLRQQQVEVGVGDAEVVFVHGGSSFRCVLGYRGAGGARRGPGAGPVRGGSRGPRGRPGARGAPRGPAAGPGCGRRRPAGSAARSCGPTSASGSR